MERANDDIAVDDFPVRCRRCDQLWREYSKATTEHVALVKEYEGTAVKDSERLRDLESRMKHAEKRRAGTRLRVQRHVASVHKGENERSMEAADLSEGKPASTPTVKTK